jgi:hypothetical protein
VRMEWKVLEGFAEFRGKRCRGFRERRNRTSGLRASEERAHARTHYLALTNSYEGKKATLLRKQWHGITSLAISSTTAGRTEGGKADGTIVAVARCTVIY